MGCGCAVSSKTQQQEQAFEVMSSQLEIRAALRLRKFRGSRRFQLSKKKVQPAEATRSFMSHSIHHLSMWLVRSEKYEGDDILHHLPNFVAYSNDICNPFLLEHYG